MKSNAAVLLPLLLVAPALHAAAPGEFWLDLLDAEEVKEERVLADLATAGVIYVGEAHTIARHHALQLFLLEQLTQRGVPLALCLEQLEATDQPAVDRYNRGEIDFEGLARAIDWAKKWKNFADYRALCEAAQKNKIPLRALNAPPDVIRAISRGGGIDKLTAAQRATLPAEIVTDDHVYEHMMNLQLATHMAMDPAKLRPVFEAQVARDETLAANILAARRADTTPDKPRTALVIVGAGHVRHGLGTPARVRRREHGIVERIVLMTESGQLKLSDAEKAAMREVTISHATLRAIGRPPGDYLHVLPRTP